MASGFIILEDGRCLARTWTVYNYILELVISELTEDTKEAEFRNWLQTLIPNENDEYNGYGGFIKHDTGEEVQRWLDLRELTKENQQLFWVALQHSLNGLRKASKGNNDNDDTIELLKTLLKMKHLSDIGDNPNKLTDWKDGYVEPPSGKRTGPGW
jgi:hypothetical protein